MEKVKDILKRVKHSDIFDAVVSVFRDMFNFTGHIDRKYYITSLLVVLILAFILSLINNIYILIPMLVLLIALLSATTRRIVDTGFKWYIAILPVIFPILSLIALFVVSYYNLMKIVGYMQGKDNSLFYSMPNPTIINIMAVGLFALTLTLIVLVVVLCTKRNKLKHKVLIKVLYIILPLISCLALTAGFSMYFNDITEAIGSNKEVISGEIADSISNTISVNGAFASDIDNENPNAVMAYYEQNKSTFEESFQKFATDKNKIDEDLYALPVLAQNVTEGSNTYPLIEVGVLNKSNEKKELTINKCGINNNVIDLSTKKTLDPGVNFIPIKLNSLDKLNGGDIFRLVVNDTTLIYSNLLDIKNYQ